MLSDAAPRSRMSLTAVRSARYVITRSLTSSSPSTLMALAPCASLTLCEHAVCEWCCLAGKVESEPQGRSSRAYLRQTRLAISRLRDANERWRWADR